MAANPPNRKVLIVENEHSIDNVLYAILAGLGSEGDAAADSDQALSVIRKNQFDALMLDLRSTPTPRSGSTITGLQASMVGRVMVVTGEVSDPKTFEMIERQAAPPFFSSRVTSNLWGRLRTLLGSAP